MMPIPTSTVQGLRVIIQNGYTGNYHGPRDYTPYPTIYIHEMSLHIDKDGGCKMPLNPWWYEKNGAKLQIPREIAGAINTLVDQKKALEAQRVEANSAEIANINAKIVELAKSFLYAPTEKELQTFGMANAPEQVEPKQVVTKEAAWKKRAPLQQAKPKQVAPLVPPKLPKVAQDLVPPKPPVPKKPM